jgi:sensor histidine kinase YesM
MFTGFISGIPYKRKLIIVLSLFMAVPCFFLGAGYLNNIKRDIYNDFSDEKDLLAKSGISNIQSVINRMYEKINFVTNYNKLNTLLATDGEISVLSSLEIYTEVNNVFEAFFAKSDSVDLLIYTTNPNIYNNKYIMKIAGGELSEFDTLPEGETVQRVMAAPNGYTLAIYKKYNMFNDFYNVVRVSVPFSELGKLLESVDRAVYQNGGIEAVIRGNAEVRESGYYSSVHTVPYLEGKINTFFDRTEPNLKYRKNLVLVSLVMAAALLGLILILHFTANLLTKKLTGVISEIKPGDGISNNRKIRKDEFDIIKDRLTELLNETKREHAQILALETEMLHQKISPHFLYNNLSAVKWNVKDETQEEIIDALVSYYRNVFQKAASECTLEEELDGISKYVELLKFSYGKNFSYAGQADSCYLNRQIPSNILQPLVENAFIHGVNCMEAGTIATTVYEDGKYFCVEVADNGTSADIARINGILENGGGSAINIVNKRIRLYYGEDYGLKYLRRGGITAAILYLPK